MLLSQDFGIMKNEQNAQVLLFYLIFAQKIPGTFFPNFWGQFPAAKLRLSGPDPYTNYFPNCVISF